MAIESKQEFTRQRRGGRDASGAAEVHSTRRALGEQAEVRRGRMRPESGAKKLGLGLGHGGRPRKRGGAQALI